MKEQATGEVVTASLVGSLAVFELSQVLSLLALTEQQGELQVVGGGIDGRLWVDHGALCGSSLGTLRTISEAVFEMSLLEDGWFYFTTGQQPPVPGEPEVIGAILDTVRPQVEEWKSLLSELPLNSLVRLSPKPPSSEVHIRAEQWQLLTLLSAQGHCVGDVIAALEQEPVFSLRLLHELVGDGLVQVVDASGVQAGDGNTFASTKESADRATGGGPDAGDLRREFVGRDAAGSVETSVNGMPPPFKPGWKIPPGVPTSSGTVAPGAGEVVPADDVTVLPPPISDDPFPETPRRSTPVKAGRR